MVYNYTKDWIYDENAPWTSVAQFKNNPSKKKKPILVPPLLEWTFFRGDKVQIMKGKDEGKIGKNVFGFFERQQKTKAK